MLVEMNYKPGKGYTSQMGSKGHRKGCPETGRASRAPHSQIPALGAQKEPRICNVTMHLTSAGSEVLVPHLL